MKLGSENIITLTKNNFNSEVLESSIPVLVDFWAAWCGPCRMLAPIFDQLADEYTGRVKFGKINVDEESELAAQYRVMSIPTLVIFKDGAIVEQIIGVHPKGDLEEMIDKAL